MGVKSENSAQGAGGAEQSELELLPLFAEGRALTDQLRRIAPEALVGFDSDDVFALEGAAPARRGPGRPRGATNRTTKDFREYCLARFGHPLTGTAIFGIWGSFEELVIKCKALQRVLDISAEKALDFMLACNGRIAPYIEGQMPVRLDAKIAGGVTIMVAPNSFTMPDEVAA